jgi:hypothetical protein
MIKNQHFFKSVQSHEIDKHLKDKNMDGAITWLKTNMKEKHFTREEKL